MLRLIYDVIYKIIRVLNKMSSKSSATVTD